MAFTPIITGYSLTVYKIISQLQIVDVEGLTITEV